MPNRSRNGVVNSPMRVVAATRVNFARSILTDLAAGPFTDDQIKLKIFHRRI